MATAAALRLCLRTSPSRSLRCQSSTGASKCLATAICPARRSLTSKTANSPLTSNQPRASQRDQRTPVSREVTRVSRGYSTKEGTIGAGEEGVGGQTMKEAPQHLNAKEKEIWGLLMRELGASELEVCSLLFLLNPSNPVAYG
jgi:hypothetical protein